MPRQKASSQLPRRQRIVALFLSGTIALLAHLSFLLLLPESSRRSQSSDYTAYYEPVAENLISGHGLTLHSKPALRYPPGIPILYAAVFWAGRHLKMSEATALQITEAFFLILSAVTLCLLTMRFFSWRVALLASGLWATYPFHLWLTKQPEAASLLSVLLLVSALLFFMWSSKPQTLSYGMLLGVVLGITALIKPFSLGLPVVFIALASVSPIAGQRRSRIVFSVSILIAYIVTISPWEILAWHLGGQWILLCTNGANVLIDGITFGTERGLAQVAMPHAARVLVADAVAQYPHLKTTGSIVHFLLAKIHQTPSAVLELFLVKAGRSWFASESHTAERLIIIVQLCYLPFVILGAHAVWKRGDTQQKNFVLFALAMLAYFWGMTTVISLSILRYMVPMICLMMVLVAVSLEALTNWLCSSRPVKVLVIGNYPPPMCGWAIQTFWVTAELRRRGQVCDVLNLNENRMVKSPDYIDVTGAWDYLTKVVGCVVRGYRLNVHVNGTSRKGYILALIATITGWLALRPVALTFHGGLSQGYFPRYDSPPLYLAFRLLFSAAGKIACDSREIKRAIESYGISPNKVADIATFSPQYLTYTQTPLPTEVGAFLFEHWPVFCSYLCFRPEYRLETIREAMNLFRRAYSNAGFIWVGFPARELPSAHAFLKTWSEEERRSLLLIGNIGHDEFLTLLTRCSAYLRSPACDGVAASVLESLALGVPVVASENGRRPAGVVTYRDQDAADLCAKMSYVTANDSVIRARITHRSVGNEDFQDNVARTADWLTG
ncbi:MAG TPA: hypothetical protein VKQ11_22610 [Candidatus Sulfotelmatobacter sp.]|nr:hypothetical protein [Candidatus Sulfotelmatobacter sp.]